MWFILALTAALATSCLLIVSKRLVSQLDPIVGVFLGYGISAFFLCLTLIATHGFPAVTLLFFGLGLASASLDAVAKMATLTAIKHTQLSVVAPITAFTPVFTVFFGYTIIHEQPTPIKLIGTLFIVCGAYLLNLRVGKNHWLEPIRLLLLNRGVWLILLASLIEGFSPIVQKRLIFQTTPETPLFAAFISFTLLVLLLAPTALVRMRRQPALKADQLGLTIVFGLLASIVTYCGWTAFTLTNTSYVVALAKMSIVFSVLLAVLVFRERISRERWIGVIVMVLGAIALVA